MFWEDNLNLFIDEWSDFKAISKYLSFALEEDGNHYSSEVSIFIVLRRGKNGE